MILDPWVWLGVFILLSYTVEAITGFGSLVIALSLGALMLPINQMMPVVVPLNVLMTGYLVWRNRRYVYWPVLIKLILPLMLLGTLAGYGLRPWLGDSLLKLLFGALVFWFASRELWRMYRGIQIIPHTLMLSRALTFGAGITHGLFASGGPLLVYAMGGIELDKSRMRATLLFVWFTLNGCLSVLFLIDGTLIPSLPRTIFYLPLLVVGVLLGEYLHHRLNEQRFRQLIYGLLVITGALLMIKAVI